MDYIGYKNRLIDTEVLIRNLADMAKYDVRSVMFAGEGEPLLHPKLSTIINQCPMDVAITTNGVALTNKFVDDCLEDISWIKVSMNGGSTTYGAIHKARDKDFELVWRNLEYAIYIKRKEKLNTAIGIQSVLLPDNMYEMEQLALRARESGLDYFVVKPYSQHHKSVTTTYSEMHYNTTNINELLWKLGELSTDKFEVVARTKSMESWDKGSHGYDRCPSTPYLWAYIMATGDVYGCSAYLLDDRFKYGNINEKLFSEIWLGKERKGCMDFVENKLDISECRLNCRMHKVNQFLWDIKHPGLHANFI